MKKSSIKKITIFLVANFSLVNFITLLIILSKFSYLHFLKIRLFSDILWFYNKILQI